MTAQFLSNELAAIIQESKRKHAELRTAGEKSLSDLKGLPSTSEAQLAADLRRRPYFVNPFILACKTGNAKLALSATSCLQRLVVANGLSREKLKDVIEAFQDCNKIGLDVQLKILQSLPSLLQIYSSALEGDLQASLFQLCTTLQQVKAVAVSSTASATLQQLVTFLYEKVEAEDGRSEETPAAAELDLGDERVFVRAGAYDAFRVFQDLCLLTEGQRARFVGSANISQTFGLELIEAILTNHGDLFESHPEQAHVLRERAVPLVIHLLSEKPSFPVTLRTVRILCILLREHLVLLGIELEIPLSLLGHMLESDVGTPWRRALCMETFRVVFSTPNLATSIYQLFDKDENRKNIVQDCLANFVRIASERPALIGIGQQSSFPVGLGGSKVDSSEQAAMEAGNITGIISGDVGVSEVNAPGISTEWSTMRVPCLDQLDKTEAPPIPETYIYSLVLICINSLAEGLAKSVLPLTSQTVEKNKSKSRTKITNGQNIERVASPDNADADQQGPGTITESKKSRLRYVPINPIELENHPAIDNVRTIAKLVNDCWPAILATLSTFLYAALDADYYRGLVRSFQRLTQVAGLLRLVTPQDAFLTALAKAAVPSNIRKGSTISSPLSPSQKGGSTMDAIFGQTPSEIFSRSRGTSIDNPGPSMNQRNLMCLRALLNLAIALGPVLEGSWSIIFENLAKADNILTNSGTAASAQDYKANSSEADREGGDLAATQTSVTSEVAAVEAAAARLFEATSEYPNSSFISIVAALGSLSKEESDVEAQLLSPVSPMTQRRQPSMASITIAAPSSLSKDKRFAVAKLGELARLNIQRLAYEPGEGVWTIIVQKMQEIASSSENDANTRIRASEVLGNIAVGTTLTTMSDEADIRIDAQRRALSCLQDLIASIHGRREQVNHVDVDVHRIALDALHSILDQCGEALLGGWASILTIIASSLRDPKKVVEGDIADHIDYAKRHSSIIDIKLVKSAFGSVQLICSDFLKHLPPRSTMNFINIMSGFCSQRTDINISLTTIGLFWNVSDFFHGMLPEEMDLNPIQNIPEAIEPLKSQSASFTHESVLALWMILQVRLAEMTDDDRADLRNGLVHTAFRILRNCGDTVSASVELWYFGSVIVKMLEINLRHQAHQRGEEHNIDWEHVKTLAVTSQNIVKGLAGFLSSRHEKISRTPEFRKVWSHVLDLFASLLAFSVPELSNLVFSALTQVLEPIKDPQYVEIMLLAKILSLWINNIPRQLPDSKERLNSLGDALLTYLHTAKQIYRLMSSGFKRREAFKLLENFSTTLALSNGTSRSTDVEVLSPIQKEVLDSIQMLKLDQSDLPTAVLDELGQFSSLPYCQTAEEMKKANFSHTCVAFSKHSMDCILRLLDSHNVDDQIYMNDTVNKVIHELSQSISRKYVWKIQGKEPSLWKKATSVVVSIFEKMASKMENLKTNFKITTKILESLVMISGLITMAPRQLYPPNPVLVEDETFDMESHKVLRNCIMAWKIEDQSVFEQLLIENALADFDSIRGTYVYGLFNSSLIHDIIADLEKPQLMVADLYSIPDGRIHDPPFNRRIRMCYYCLDELFALCSASRGLSTTFNSGQNSMDESERIISPLATFAFPILMLRCALPLKRYIADQPLRGRMPTPASQRLELIYVLKRIAEFECTPAIEHAPLPSIKHQLASTRLGASKRHLEWLMPLVSMACPYARDDQEIADALQRVLNVCFHA